MEKQLLQVTLPKIIQAQGFHWNNQHASIHPFLCYFKNPNSAKENCYTSAIAITSDCLTHDTAALSFPPYIFYKSYFFISVLLFEIQS
jgi:hypothetical protein